MTPVRLIGINTMCLSPLTIPGSRHHQLLAVLLFAFTNLILIPHHCSPAYLKNFSSVSTIRVKSSVHTLRERITEENVEWEQNLVLVNVRIRVIILRVQLSEILSKLPMIGQLKDFQVRSLRLAE